MAELTRRYLVDLNDDGTFTINDGSTYPTTETENCSTYSTVPSVAENGTWTGTPGFTHPDDANAYSMGWGISLSSVFAQFGPADLVNGQYGVDYGVGTDMENWGMVTIDYEDADHTLPTDLEIYWEAHDGTSSGLGVNEDGQLNFFVGRDIFESKMKYRNSPTPKDVVGFELFINWDEPIVLCEGPFDAIAIKRNAIPLFGKTILSNLKRKIIEKKVKQVYISLDKDAILDSIKMVEDFMKNDIDVYFVNLPEKDPSDLGFEKVIPLLKETEKMKFSDLMRYKLNGKVKKSINI